MRLSIQANVNKISVEGKLCGKRGVTPHASQIKLKSTKTKPTEVIYTAINTNLMNIVRVQKAQGTETTPTQSRCNINVVVAMLF